MKSVRLGVVLIGLLLVAGSGWADSSREKRPIPPAVAEQMMQQMMPGMMQSGSMPEMLSAEPVGQAGHHHAPGMMSPAGKPVGPGARLEMMVRMLSGRGEMHPAKMRGVMDQLFYLDRAQQLGLSAEQRERLRSLQSDCRRDNIRTGAELRIVLLELEDLLAGDWSLKEAELLIRKARRLEGDIQLRHLQAQLDARAVLTPEQLERARQDESGSLEELFQ